MDYNISYREKNNSIQIIISYKDNFWKWKEKSKQGFKTKREAKKGSIKLLEKLENNFKLNGNSKLLCNYFNSRWNRL